MMPSHRNIFETRARGKLLLTAEYAVLNGATALALPLRYGQTLRVETQAPARLSWISQNANGSVWFEAEFGLPDPGILAATDAKTAQMLAAVLLACRKRNPAFLMSEEGLRVVTRIDFPRDWGLGTSSTLIAATAKWAGVDPYGVLSETFGGSGYDIACAYAEGPILYRRMEGMPAVQTVDWRPAFAEHLYFVYLGKKQDSREGISRYRARAQANAALVLEISALTERFLTAETLDELEDIIRRHEKAIGDALGLPRAKLLYFSDFWGEIKSLGAWGGDFVLATSGRPEAETRAYFSGKGFDTLLPWREIGIERREENEARAPGKIDA